MISWFLVCKKKYQICIQLSPNCNCNCTYYLLIHVQAQGYLPQKNKKYYVYILDQHSNNLLVILYLHKTFLVFSFSTKQTMKTSIIRTLSIVVLSIFFLICSPTSTCISLSSAATARERDSPRGRIKPRRLMRSVTAVDSDRLALIGDTNYGWTENGLCQSLKKFPSSKSNPSHN